MKTLHSFTAVAFAIGLSSMAVAAEPPASPGLTPAIFSDHMVLQRQVEVPVWGATEPGGTVAVKFMNQNKTAKADDKGKWMVKLDKMEAVLEPQEMTVQDSKETRVFKDVLVGEVWLGSGQSNMEFGTDFNDAFKLKRWKKDMVTTTMGDCVDEKTKEVLRRAIGNPMIRVSSKTRDHLNTKDRGWERVDEKNAITISSLAGCIAVYLQEELKVPVGIIIGSVSSSAMVRWIEKDDFLNHPLVKAQSEQNRAAGGSPTLTGVAAREGFGGHYRDYIEPVAPYALRGFIWDQGENGIGYRGVDWTAAMHALVTSWRKAWGQGDLPWSATDHYENELEANMEQAGVKNFRIAKTDGLSRALHPLNKWQYAQRHLDNIFPMAYGRPVPKWHAPAKIAPPAETKKSAGR